MARHLIVFTARTGSTLLSELISSTTASPNYGEGWKLGPGQQDITHMFDMAHQARDPIALNNYINQYRLRGSSLLKQSNWVAKLNAYPASTYCNNIIDSVIGSGGKVWLTYRSNIHHQFLSFVNALYRQSLKNPNSFLFTNNCDPLFYERIDLPQERLYNTLTIFLQTLISWRLLFDKYKHKVNLVNYEENLYGDGGTTSINLTKFGITDENVLAYFDQKTHLVRTPFNSRLFLNNDAWESCIEVLNRHQHLVEI